jgi:hypothetical protein
MKLISLKGANRTYALAIVICENKLTPIDALAIVICKNKLTLD